MNCWLQHKDFDKFVTDKWANSHFEGSSSYVLKEKLKSLKTVLKEWNKGERDAFEEGHALKHRELFEIFRKLSRMQDSFIFQRSRLRWLQQGDSNSIFSTLGVK